MLAAVIEFVVAAPQPWKFGCDGMQPFGVLTEKEIDGTRPASALIIGSLVLFDRGDEVTVQTSEEGIRFLLVPGKPLREPIGLGMDQS